MVQWRNEAYKNSAKIIQKFTVRRGRSHRRPPSEYATELFNSINVFLLLYCQIVPSANMHVAARL